MHFILVFGLLSAAVSIVHGNPSLQDDADVANAWSTGAFDGLALLESIGTQAQVADGCHSKGTGL